VPIHDYAGSVACLLDAGNGDLVERYRYSAYGEETFDDAISPWRFSSKRYDDESGFIYFGRRYYDPESGRWVTPDPLGREGGPNLYAYVLNNPLAFVDHYGLFASFMDSMSSFGSAVGGALMSAFGFVAQTWQTLCPFPIVRDTLAATHHLMQNGTLTGFRMDHQRPRSHLGHIYGWEGDPLFKIGSINGMLNNTNSSAELGMMVSAGFGGMGVDFFVNQTHGPVVDLLKTGVLMLGIQNSTSESLANAVLDELNAMGPDGALMLIGHSQGGQLISSLRYFLSQSQLRQIHVVTLGSATIVSQEGFGSAVNYVSMSDPIPFIADPIGIIKSCYNKNYDVRFIEPTSIFDHPAKNYQRVIDQEGAKFLNKFYRNK
jgi:RHS repeat-associated protein